ncbi:uncharacterized protein QC763_503915 [Podospora pseudopauciseta]|uniref:AAA+ ATPase lid domain-containing protein n=1 Tax=Podospora pseudopauciseta TaxID=2093780 RepID=A0ABR0H8P3_9PEZI|nr:hypothetical protein QC763_503915 [Podospora pseudopauciseta]
MAIAVEGDPTIRRGLGSLLAESQNSFVNDHLRPKMLHLLPGTVPGFSLRNRKWGRLSQVEHNYGWDDLVLPPGHRKVVQAMVETHATYKPDGHPATGNGRGAWKRSDQTIEIFRHNFERLEKTNEGRQEHNLPPFEYKDQQGRIVEWANEQWKTLRWNGRQIRNAFQTVMALAEFKAKRKQTSDGQDPRSVLTKRCFEIVPNQQGGLTKREQAGEDNSMRKIKKNKDYFDSDESEADDSEEAESKDQTETEEDSDEEEPDEQDKRKGSKTGKKCKDTKGKKSEGRKGGSNKKKKGKKAGSDEDEDGRMMTKNGCAFSFPTN